MYDLIETKRLLLQELDDTVDLLLKVYQNIANPDMMVYELWSIRDIFAHLTFWHESFARNTQDIARGIKPTPPDGKYRDLNQAGIDEMRLCSFGAVIQRFQAAHAIIQTNILNPRITSIPYKKGSRNYTPEEHLKLVNDHIGRHLRDIIKACKLKPLFEKRHQSL